MSAAAEETSPALVASVVLFLLPLCCVACWSRHMSGRAFLQLSEQGEHVPRREEPPRLALAVAACILYVPFLLSVGYALRPHAGASSCSTAVHCGHLVTSVAPM